MQYDAEGHCCRATLSGEFSLCVATDDPFRVRLAVLFLRLLDAEGRRRGRRTRDGRTPAVRERLFWLAAEACLRL